jgi:hypothetical protein
MKRFALMVTFLFCQSALAESWLCIPEVGTYMDALQPFNHGNVMTGDKYLLKLDPQSSQYELIILGGFPTGLICDDYPQTIHCVVKGSKDARMLLKMFHLVKESKTFHFTDAKPYLEARQPLPEHAGMTSTRYYHWAGKCDQV